jgi:hypothetical protein
MSTKTSFKRVALVAVAALGMGVLTSVSPANASARTMPISGTTVARSGSAGAAIVLTPSAALAATDTLTVTILTRDGVALNTIPAGITFAGNANTTVTSSGATFTGRATGAVTSGTITVANTAAIGKYTFSAQAIDHTTSGDSSAVITGTFYVSTAPTKAAFDKATYSTEGTDVAAAQISLTDAQGNPSYLIAGEAISVTSSATAAISSVNLLDSGSYAQADATTGYKATNLSNSSGTAGTYTYTVNAASGQTGFTAGTASLTVAAAAATVESATLTTGTLAFGYRTNDNTVLRTSAATAAANEENTSIFVSPSQTAIEFNLVDTAETTAKNFKYSISQTASVPFPGGIAASAAPVYVAATVDADGTGSTAKVKVTTTSALAGTGYTLTIEGGSSRDIVYVVLYQAPIAFDIDLFDAQATTIGAVKLATTSQKVIVKDQFGSAFAGAVISYTTATRNTVAVKTAVSAADGTATISTTDAALSTSTADDAFNAQIPNLSITGLTIDRDANTTIKYYATAAEITASAVTLAVTQDSDANGSYDATITTSTTASVTVDTNLANSTNTLKIADQVAITATIANAAGTNPQGVPVSVSGSAGVYFLTGSSVGEVLVGSQTGAVTTIATYTDASGQYSFQAGFTKSGTATITVKSGSVTKTYSIKVVAGAAGIVKSTASASGVVTATVTDLWGNPVSGVNVDFVAASGALLGGNFATLRGVTGADGTASVVATGGTATAKYVISATITGGDSAVVADTTNGVPAGVATVDVSASAVGVSGLDALTALVNSLLKKINAMQTLLNKIQKKLGVK